MIDFTITKTTTASIDSVFDRLTDHRAYKDMTPLRKSTLDREGTPAPNGVGAVRRLGMVGPPQTEEVTVYERPNKFAYKLLTGLPVKDHVGTVELAETGGHTTITYHVRSTPTIPGGGLVLGPVLKKAIGDLLKGVIKAAERA
ncbi:MAG: hypothetical protein QOF76_765 [Solirubrobacteraceae bacterium]|jgi:hypothetical protein|nr:hypothetical protein [Solirubrobacteraceae bacterium]